MGTIHLGDSLKPWIQGSSLRSIPDEAIASAYAFDAMVQNSDRMADNPNFLWRGAELALLDFDKAFGFVRTEGKNDKPWRNALNRQSLARHCLHGHLPAFGGEVILGKNLWDSFEEWWLGKSSGRLSAEIASGLADPDLDLPRLEAYLTKLAAGADDFFRFLSDVSRHP